MNEQIMPRLRFRLRRAGINGKHAGRKGDLRGDFPFHLGGERRHVAARHVAGDLLQSLRAFVHHRVTAAAQLDVGQFAQRHDDALRHCAAGSAPMVSGLLPVLFVENHRHVEDRLPSINLRHDGSRVSRLDGVEHFHRAEAVLQQAFRPQAHGHFRQAGLRGKIHVHRAGNFFQNLPHLRRPFRRAHPDCCRKYQRRIARPAPESVSSMRSPKGDSMENVAPGNCISRARISL